MTPAERIAEEINDACDHEGVSVVMQAMGLYIARCSKSTRDVVALLDVLTSHAQVEYLEYERQRATIN